MSRFASFVIVASAMAAGVVASVSSAAPAPPAPAPSTAPAAPSNPPAPCVFTNFRTQLVAQACARGGQNEAKEVMKAFTKDKKIKSCNQCHSKLAPKYELKADGLEQFFKSGGK